MYSDYMNWSGTKKSVPWVVATLEYVFINTSTFEDLYIDFLIFISLGR